MLLPWNLRVKSVSWKGVFFKARPILRFSSFELLAVAALCRQHIRYMHMHMHMHMHMCIHAHVTCMCMCMCMCMSSSPAHRGSWPLFNYGTKSPRPPSSFMSSSMSSSHSRAL
jgi:hypothetical protein